MTDELSLSELFETLEASWAMLEGGQGERGPHERAIMGVLALVLEHPAEGILEAARGSFLPTRALVSWMIFEAERMGGAGASRALELRRLWQPVEAAGGGGILPPPPQPTVMVH